MPFEDENSEESAFHTYSRQQAQELRKANPPLSPWRVVRWMLAAAVLIGVVAAIAFDESVAWSAAYGGLVVALPAAVMARGMTSPLSRTSSTAGAMAFLLWEMVKIGLSIGMLMLAPSLIADLSWPALLVGLILTLKVYFVAAVVRPQAVRTAIEAYKN